MAVVIEEPAVDLPHYEEFSSMGKRVQAGESAKTTKAAKEEAVSFGERLSSLLPQIAAVLGVAEKRKMESRS